MRSCTALWYGVNMILDTTFTVNPSFPIQVGDETMELTLNIKGTAQHRNHQRQPYGL